MTSGVRKSEELCSRRIYDREFQLGETVGWIEILSWVQDIEDHDIGMRINGYGNKLGDLWKKTRVCYICGKQAHHALRNVWLCEAHMRSRAIQEGVGWLFRT